MTEEDFYAELRTLAQQDWEIRIYQIHPTHVWVVRLAAPPWAWPNGEEEFCPVTAVCLGMRGRHFLARDYLDAGDFLGLKPDFLEAVVRAADQSPNHDRDVRRRLLQALGLAEAPEEVA